MTLNQITADDVNEIKAWGGFAYAVVDRNGEVWVGSDVDGVISWALPKARKVEFLLWRSKRV